MFGFVSSGTGRIFVYDTEEDARAAASDMGLTRYTLRPVTDLTTGDARRRAREAADRQARRTPDVDPFLALGQ